MNVYHLKEKAIQLAEESRQVNKELSSTLKELQRKCIHPHEQIIEAPYKSQSYMADLEEIRLCKTCGLQEIRSCTGWNYIINRTGEYGQGKTLQKVTRDQLYETRTNMLRGTSVGVTNKEHLGE